MAACKKRWNIKSIETRLGPCTLIIELDNFAMNGRSIPFLNSVKYILVIFDKKIAWRLHIETVETTAFKGIH
jgi:hypothetical protein